MRNVIEVFTNCYGAFGVRAAVEGAAKAGLSHIELALRGHGEGAHEGGFVIPESQVISVQSTPEQVADFKRFMAEKGVRAISGMAGADLRHREGVETVKKQLRIAKELGISLVTLSVGERSSTVYDHLLELADDALTLGIRLALETHPPLVTNAEEGLKTMRDLKHRNIGINYDTANVYFYNQEIDTVAEVEKLLPYIYHVHLKDSRKGYRDWYFPALGEGTIDLPGVFRVLNEAGFYGPFSMEIEGIQGEPELTLEQRQARIEKSVAYLRQIGVIA